MVTGMPVLPFQRVEGIVLGRLATGLALLRTRQEKPVAFSKVKVTLEPEEEVWWRRAGRQ